jgi:CheY-like chemotaxis protein
MTTVLVVTDDRNVRVILARMLAEHGVTPIEAEDAVEAVARVGGMERHPDLVLVDRRLARGEEMALLDSIRSRASLGDVPIVLFTAPSVGPGEPDADQRLRDAFDTGLVLAIVDAICS